MSHSPGPWYVDGHAVKVLKPEREFLGEGAPETICEMLSSVSPEETQANQTLISAAPDLLSIVLDILPNHHPDCHSDYSDGERCDECGTRRKDSNQTECGVPGCWYVRIRQAIAKATGVEP